MSDWLTTPLQYIKGVGPRRAADLARVGLQTVEDLFLRFPLRYEDRAALVPVKDLRPGAVATVLGAVLSSGIRPTRRPGFRIFELIVKDASGSVRAAFPNQSFLKDVFHPGQQVVLFGQVEFRGSGGLQFTNPEYEIIRGDTDDSDATVHTGRIVPIYEKAGAVTPRMQRTLVHRLVGQLPADSPVTIVDRSDGKYFLNTSWSTCGVTASMRSLRVRISFGSRPSMLTDSSRRSQ